MHRGGFPFEIVSDRDDVPPPPPQNQTEATTNELIGQKLLGKALKRIIPPTRIGICRDLCHTTWAILLKILKVIIYSLPAIGILLLLVTCSLPVTGPLISTILPNTEKFVTFALKALSTIQDVYHVVTHAAAPIGNALMTFIAPLIEGFNELVDIATDVWVILKTSICPNGITGNILQDCQPLMDWYNFFLASFDLIKLIWAVTKEIYKAVKFLIGLIICPGNICQDPLLCISNKAPCAYDDWTLFRYIYNFTVWFLSRAIHVLFLLIAFLRDLILLPIQILSTISVAGTFANLQGNSKLLPTIAVPYQEVIVFKDILSKIEDAVYDVTYWILNIGNFVFIVVIDTPQCNLFGDFKNCAASKTCYTFTKINIRAACVSKEVCLVSVTLDFSYICEQFGLYKTQCKCDKAIYENSLGDLLRPFSVASKSSCIPIYGNAVHARYTTCLYVTYSGNSVYYIDQNDGPCLCSLPNLGIVDGIWVPCVPSQNVCDSSISVIPRLLALTGVVRLT